VTASLAARRKTARSERVARLGLLLCPLACGADITELGSEEARAAGNEAVPRLSRRMQALSPSGALLLSDVQDVPAPVLRARGGGSEVILPGGPSPATLHVQRADGQTLTLLVGDARGNRVESVAPLLEPDAALVQVQAGVTALSLGQTDLFLVDQAGDPREIYLPEVELGAGERAEFWVAADGSTYAATPGATEPEFTTRLRARLPWRLSPDVSLTQVATGFESVSSIAFIPAPGPLSTDPLCYVLERHGTVHLVRRNGSVTEYARGLINFDALASVPAVPDQGLGSAVVDPETGDLYVTLTYSADPELPSAAHYAAIERLSSNDGGLTAATRTRLHSLEPEAEGAAHFTSQISLGTDGLLYVHVGDASQPAAAQDLERSHGKILRLTRDGAAAPRNPYYDAEDGITARDYVYASGLRDPVGGAWRLADESLYFVEQGPGIDRFARLDLGRNYGWNGSPESLTSAALYNWDPSVAPTSIAFLQSEAFAGSGFPSEYRGRAYVSQSSGSGAGDASHKTITEWDLNAAGILQEGPRPIATYRGLGLATPVALAAGPDGLYFSDARAEDPDDPALGASLLRLSFEAPTEFDCNLNGIADATDLGLGTSLDCNAQRIPDECDISSGHSLDCDLDGRPDECQVQSPLPIDFASGTPHFVLGGDAQSVAGTLELRPAPDLPASAVQDPFGIFPAQHFRVQFDVKSSGLGAPSLSFVAFDADEYFEVQSFGAEGLAAGALVLTLGSLDAEGNGENVLLLSFNGETLGRYAPSFELDDGQWHTVAFGFDGRFLNLALSSGRGASGEGVFETAFAALELPGTLPYAVRFGFGSSDAGGASEHSIENLSLWLPNAADGNGNRTPDSCECIADVDDGLSSGTADGSVTDDDLRYYLTLYRAGERAADVDDGLGSGVPDGVISIEDLRYYLQRFRGGC